MDDLRNSPQIAELLEILERNGLTKEKDEVTSLVDYIGSMESKLLDMMAELSEMRQDVRQIHDNTLRAKCSQLLQNTTDKVKQASEMVGIAKNNLIAGAKHAIEEFKLHGKSALIKAVETMRIPKTIKALQKCFRSLSVHMEHNATKTETFRSELSEAAKHLKGAGRALFGLAGREAKHSNNDKGILSKLKKTFESMSKKFSELELSSKRMADKLFGAKESVKDELAKLKENKISHKTKKLKELSR